MRRIVGSPRFWIAPIALVTFVMAILGALYMDSMLDPERNMNNFPIAVVNRDDGDIMVGSDPPEHVVLGDQVVAGLADEVDPNQIDLRPMGIAQAQQELNTGKIYGAIVVPLDFTKRTMILAQASVVPGDIERPVITVYTNPRSGTLAGNIARVIGERVGTSLNEQMGRQLTEQVTAELAATAPDLQLSGASSLLLSEPVDVRLVENNPLPPGTGFGLAAFYFTLLLVLAGFTGATIVNTVVDGMLGFTPTEVGPLYLHNESVPLSRFPTLRVKWAMMVVLGFVVSAAYLWISILLGLPVPQPLALYQYGALAIAAVGITSISVMAIFGNLGLLINLFVFIILGLPSSGGAIPLDAAPPLYAWLANFEPMHQIYVGVRAILFFDANPDAGLGQAAWMTVFGLLFGLVVGGVVTMLYDRRGLRRVHRAKAPTPS